MPFGVWQIYMTDKEVERAIPVLLEMVEDERVHTQIMNKKRITRIK